MADAQHGPAQTPSPIVGIDLGTTNSLVAIAGWSNASAVRDDQEQRESNEHDNLQPRVLTDALGHGMVPSAVRFETEHRNAPVIGYEAREDASRSPRWTVLSVKRLMGRSLEDVERSGDLRFLGYEVVEGANKTARVRLPDGRVVSPQEVSALILRRLKEIAEARLGVEISKAVVTVPAYFDDAQRQATRDAGRLAGLEVVRIVNEPTAAALAYGIGLTRTHTQARNVVVFDLGGGTFDVSLLRLTPGEGENPTDFFQVLATAGDTHLGGDDFDHALVDLIAGDLRGQWLGLIGKEAPGEFSPELRQALRMLAERVKIELSDALRVIVELDVERLVWSVRACDESQVALLTDRGLYRRVISREEFEKLVGPMLGRAMECCRRLLADARGALGGQEISAVILVGGSTRVPAVRRVVGEFFKLEPYVALDPEQVVALGAAVQASILAGSTRGSLLLDVVPLSLGIETAHGAMSKIIMKNSPVPARAGEMFSTSVDGQTSIKLNILQGEREMAADCRSLGTFHLRGIPSMPAGIPQVQVDFLVDSNGVLSVQAVERRSGKRANLQIVPNHGLTQEEVERIEAQSFAHAREDMTRHRIADLIANTRLDVKWIRRALQRTRDELEPGYANDIEARLGALEAMASAAQGDWRAVDPNGFHQAKEELDRASMRLHEAAIAKSLREEQGH